MKTIDDFKNDFDHQEMGLYRWLAVSICVLIFIIDGFDILVMAFTAHSISKDWGMNGAEIGSLISSGLIGAAVGSFFIAPLGDRYGRKKIMMFSLYLAALTMMASAFTHHALQLGSLRFLTGVAVGGVLGNCNVLTSEYSSKKWRSLTVCLLSTGYALGATLGGLLAIFLDQKYGWHSVFLVGGMATLVVAVIATLWLPESLYYLLQHQTPSQLKKIQALEKKFKLKHLSEITASTKTKKQSNVRSIFTAEYAKSTVLLWIAMFCMMFGFYYILTWTPKILANNGMSNTEGMSAGVLINLGAVMGTLLFGFLGTKYKIKSLQVIFMVLTALLTLFFAFSLNDYKMALLVGLVVGVFGVGAKAGIQVVAPQIYSPYNRATGVGLAIGIGRIGSMLSPIVAGLLLDAGWMPKSLFIFASLFFIVAMFALMTLKSEEQGQHLQTTELMKG